MVKRSSSIIYEIQDEPIVIHKSLFDLLLKHKNFAELYALYSFYYYTAKWQKTNIPKATNSYVAKGIGWGIEKVQKYKTQLVKIGLIEKIVSRNENSQIMGHYVKIKFIWGAKKVVELQSDFTRQGKLPDMARSGINALSTNNKNALNINNKNSCDFPKDFQKSKEFIQAWEEWNQHRKEKRNPLTPTAIKRQIKLLTKYSIKEAIQIINKSLNCGYTGLFDLPKSNDIPIQDPDHYEGFVEPQVVREANARRKARGI